MKKLLISIVLTTLSYSLNAQTYEQNQIDSLLRIVNNPAVKDANRIYPLARISWLYLSLGDSIQVEKYITQASKLARNQKDSKYMIYVYNQALMNCLETYPKKIKAAYLIIDSIYIAIAKTADLEAQALGYSYIGNAKWRTDSEYNFDDFYKSLSIAEKLPEESKSKYEIMFDTYRTFFGNYEYKNKENAEKYILLMLQTAKILKDKDLICQSLARKLEFASTYLQNNKDSITQNVIELNNFILKNIEYITQYTYTLAVYSITLAFDNLQDIKQKQLIAGYIENLKIIAESNFKNKQLLNNIKFVYAYSQKNYAEAIELALQIIKHDEGETSAALYGNYNNLAEVYMQTKQYEQAANAYKKSLDFYQRYTSAQTEEQRQVNDVKFGVLKQQQQIRQQQRKILYITVTALFVFVVLITIILLLNRQKKIDNLKRKNAELLEKQAIEEKEKAKLIAEKATLEKEKLGERLITNETELMRKNQLLDNAKNMDSKQLEKAIKRELKTAKLTKDYAKLFHEIRPEFYEWLAQQAAPNHLSKTDLKYCAYISLRMDNKELANVMNIGYNTVVSQKHNLKKKLHLEGKDNLEAFIVKFAPPN